MAQMTPTYDYETDAADILRRQKLLDAMQVQALSPMEMPTNQGQQASKASPISALAKIAQAYMANQQQGGLKDERAQLGSRYAADLHSNMSRFIDGISAQPGMQPEVQGNNPSAYVAPTMQSPQDAALKRREAVFEAIASNHPVMKELGMAQLKQMTSKDGQITPKDMLPYADPAAIPAMAASGTAGFKPKKDIAEVGGVVYDKNTLQILKINGSPPDHVKIEGDLYEVNQSTGQLKKLDNAPKITVSTKNIVNSGETAFSKTLGETTAKDVDEIRKTSITAQKMLPVLTKLEQLNANPSYSGPTAGAAVFMGELAGSLGIPVDKTKVTGSEEYQSVLAKKISDYLTAGAGVGRSLTDADRAAIEAQFPALIRTPEGRTRIVGMLRQSAMNDIEHGKQVETEIGKQFPELGRVRAVAPVNSSPYPGTVSPTPAGKPIVKNW